MKTVKLAHCSLFDTHGQLQHYQCKFYDFKIGEKRNIYFCSAIDYVAGNCKFRGKETDKVFKKKKAGIK
jgi:hypothetical protein